MEKEIVERAEEIPMKKIALELDTNNIVIGSVYQASQDYAKILKGNPKLIVVECVDIDDIIPYKTKYQNGQLVQLADYCQDYYTKQSIEEQRQLLQLAIEEINQWFNEYDMQVKQYERDVRLGIVGTYHIGNDTYSIQELDQTAIQKASQINNLRQQLNNLQ